jgi:hypothetical protein
VLETRFGLVAARSIALLALAAGVGCGSSPSGGGTGGSAGSAGNTGNTGSSGKGGGPGAGGSSVAGSSGTGGGSEAGTSGTGTGGSGVAGAGGTGTGGTGVAGAGGAGTGGSTDAGVDGTGIDGSSVAGSSGTGTGASAGGQSGQGGQGGQGGNPSRDGGSDAATTDAHKDAQVDATDAETDAAPPACTNACTLGARRCASGGSQGCLLGANGCTAWGTTASCVGVTSCSSSTGLCVCPPAPAGCTASGTLCDSSGNLVTCTLDAQGCLSASAPFSCPSDESCKGPLPNAACSCDNNPSCIGQSAFCLNASTIAACGSDSNTPACRVVASTTSCHGSSLCANGACVCPAVGTAAGTGCATLNAKACAGTDILTCATEASSGCKIWQASTHCGANGFTCGSKASTGPACQCPENAGTDVYVDPSAGSDVLGGVFPTGIPSPATCRYATLTNGLTKVGAPGRVIAISANLPATFGGETFPLNVPAGVNVMTADATLNASDYLIAFSGGPAAVVLNNGTALRGFSINGSGAAAALISCSAGTTVLDTLSLNGNNTVTDGVDLSGTCAATLTNVVTISQLAGVGLNVSSSAATNLTGTTTISATSIGVQLTNGSLTASGLNSDGNRQYGIILPSTAAGTPLLNLNQSTASGNGTGGVFAGISIGKGSLTASNTQVDGNGGIGIELNTSATHQLTSVMSLGNGAASGASFGVALTAGTVVATGLTASSNTDSGVSVSGGTATLTGSTLDENTGRGLIVTGAGSVVTVSGGELSGNGQSGILASNGTLNVGGGTVLASNDMSGINLTGATAVITSVNVHDNLLHGVVVNSANSAPVNLGPGATVNHNGGDGLLVDTSPLTTGGANSLTVDTVTVSNNAKFGIYLAGDDGDVAATIKGSTITGNADVGLMVEEGATATTSEAIQNNDVNGNNSGNGHQVGGVLFNTASTLTSFIGNKVHSNTGDELGFNAAPNGGGTQWVINPPSAACDTTSNSLYCYGNGNVGLHILGGGATVNAQHVRWTNNPPTSGIDYSGAVSVTNPCAVVTTCP